MLKGALISSASFSESKEIDNIDEIYQWFQGKHSELKDIELSIQNKMSIAKKLLRYPKLFNSVKKEIVSQVAELDVTSNRVRFERKCAALLADSEKLKQLWEEFMDPEAKDSVMVMRNSMEGYVSNRLLDQQEHSDKFFSVVEDIFAKRKQFFANSFFDFMWPSSENLV